MTDKQIIDDVDVSKCKYHDRGWCLLSESYVDREHIRYRPCGDMTFFDCYYKNWKRKEQECEELKNFHINLVGVKECEIKELAELKKENKKLEYQIEKERKENWDLRGQLGEAECLLCRYDRALTEIKEIAEEIENNDLYVTVPAKARMGDKIKINLIGFQGILDIISEVENVQ